MPLTLAQVQERITRLEDAISTGQLRVSYSDKTVQFQDIDAMFRALAWLQGKEQKLAGTTGSGSQIRMVTGDGYGRE